MPTKLRQRFAGKSRDDEPLLPTYYNSAAGASGSQLKLRRKRKNRGCCSSGVAILCFVIATTIIIALALASYFFGSGGSHFWRISNLVQTINRFNKLKKVSTVQKDGEMQQHQEEELQIIEQKPWLARRKREEEQEASIAAGGYMKHEEKTYKKVNCSDGSSEGWLNDDYCDCTDGSDEPNTSACSDKLAYKKTFPCADGSDIIFASRVGDGIFDCPDKSDEIMK